MKRDWDLLDKLEWYFVKIALLIATTFGLIVLVLVAFKHLHDFWESL